eukprot:TRINITY_DN1032_c0_g1_i2.p1 TRINITY_DN1032_c0_g1~~TRINITY_DN1032_c0_g1_i2.p1  ORF type:complete len:997 (-),score=164.60 TRINITY_DN1032_c0_g1_i2:145-3135(-)
MSGAAAPSPSGAVVGDGGGLPPVGEPPQELSATTQQVAHPTAELGSDLELGKQGGSLAALQALQPGGAVYAAVGSGPPLRVTVHTVQGSLCTSMTSPFVRMHVVDSSSGLWCLKAPPLQAQAQGAGREQAVYNVDDKGKPYLRTTPTRQEPWQADISAGSHIRPFASVPCSIKRDSNGTPRAAPNWNEAFMFSQALAPGTLLLIEVLDVVEDRHQQGGGLLDARPKTRYVSLGWAFLDLDAVSSAQRLKRSRGRRLRLQLYRYLLRKTSSSSRSAGWFSKRLNSSDDGAPSAADHQADGGRSQPDVYLEYRGLANLGSGEREDSGVLGGLLAAATCRRRKKAPLRRSPWPAIVEISVDAVQSRHEVLGVPSPQALESGSAANTTALLPASAPLPAAAELTLSTVDAGAHGLSSGGEESGVEEQVAMLAPHFSRYEDEASIVPDGLLWQISAGKRGAYRLCLSPSGFLLAAAVAKRGGASELRVFNLNSGRLHAACASPHDAFVYDLCWHTFGPPSGTMGGATERINVTTPQLLISCGGDGLIQIFEIREDTRMPRTGFVRPHARIQMPSHVYSVRPHVGLSSDPERLILACGGHTFGLGIIKVVRLWQQHQDGDGPGGDASGGRWMVPSPPTQDIVNFKAPVSHSNVPELLGGRRRSRLGTAGGSFFPTPPSSPSQAHDEPNPDILCVRFSESASSADNLYCSDAAGRILIFQVRFDASLEAGRGGVKATLVRVYSSSDLSGAPIHSMEVVTPQLLEGKRLNHVLLSTVDDWLMVYSRDHSVRLVTLQRGVARVELELQGMAGGTFPLRGAMAPDGSYVACGSETGELLCWNATDGRALPKTLLPQVQLSGPVLDVVWSRTHHLIACCALDDQAPPILVFAGGDPERPMPAKKVSTTKLAAVKQAPAPQEMPMRFVPLREAPRPETTLMSIAPPAASSDWASKWLNCEESNPGSAISVDEKRRMKEKILGSILETKAIQDLDRSFNSMRTLPGGLG